MAERSHVTSVEAIEAFRANLIVYLSKARPALEEVSNEVLRTRFWLENEQRNRWAKEVKVRGRELEEAQQELFTAKVSKLREATAAKEMAVRRAMHALREAEEKLGMTRKWGRELENLAEPLIKQVDALHSFLTSDMGKAVAYLAQVIKALEAYTDVAAPGASLNTPAPESAKADEPPPGEPDTGNVSERNRS